MFDKIKIGDIVAFPDEVLGLVIGEVERVKKQRDFCTHKTETRIDLISIDGAPFTRFNPAHKVRKVTLYDLVKQLHEDIKNTRHF